MRRLGQLEAHIVVGGLVAAVEGVLWLTRHSGILTAEVRRSDPFAEAQGTTRACGAEIRMASSSDRAAGVTAGLHEVLGRR
jgi:hypothetical protein